MVDYDFIIVGAGISGCTCAERLTSKNYKVLLVDKNKYVGGLCYDEYDENNILVQRFGPHIIHTNNNKVWNYLSKFTNWFYYHANVLGYIEGKYVPIPFNLKSVEYTFPKHFSDSIKQAIYYDKNYTFKELFDSSYSQLNKLGSYIKENVFVPYSEKQWGKPWINIDKSLMHRVVPFRANYDDRYYTAKYQAVPMCGFSKLFSNMVDSHNINIMLGVDYFNLPNIAYKNLIFTGCVDKLFNYRFGKLDYRHINFKHRYFTDEYKQSTGVINYPKDFDFTRVSESKHLTNQKTKGTVLTYEFPGNNGFPAYCVDDKENKERKNKYLDIVNNTKNLYVCGRLGNYSYWSADEAVNNALSLTDSF
ncbi:MAG: UDP-galactopyranose mutase [Chitinivibrionales bacterium]|nr:UDP-galactopyranose mutase [Chitinivibrionales bacterium]